MNDIMLVGCGYWGKNYLRILSELDCVDEIIIVDNKLNTEECDRLINKYPKIANHFKELVDLSLFDAAIISTPSSTHYQLAKELLSNGLHVLVEKPMALTTKEALSLKELSQKHKKILMTGNTFLFHPAINHIKHLIENGVLGEIQYIQFKRVHLGLTREDVNVIWDLLPHDISILLYLIGDGIKSIQTERFSFGDKTDAVSVNMKMNAGQLIHMFGSWADCEKERTITIVGTKAKIIFDDLNLQRPVTIIKKELSSDTILADCASQADHLSKTCSGELIMPKILHKEPLKTQTENFLLRSNNEYEWNYFDEIGLKSVEVLERVENAAQEI